MTTHLTTRLPTLWVGTGNAQTDVGDPYLPIREAMGMLTAHLNIHATIQYRGRKFAN